MKENVLKLMYESRNSLTPKQMENLEDFIDLSLELGLIGPVKIKPYIANVIHEEHRFNIGIAYGAQLFVGRSISCNENFAREIYLPNERERQYERTRLMHTAINRRDLLREKGLVEGSKIFEGLREISEEEQRQLTREAETKGILPYNYIPPKRERVYQSEKAEEVEKLVNEEAPKLPELEPGEAPIYRLERDENGATNEMEDFTLPAVVQAIVNGRAKDPTTELFGTIGRYIDLETSKRIFRKYGERYEIVHVSDDGIGTAVQIDGPDKGRSYFVMIKRGARLGREIRFMY